MVNVTSPKIFVYLPCKCYTYNERHEHLVKPVVRWEMFPQYKRLHTRAVRKIPGRFTICNLETNQNKNVKWNALWNVIGIKVPFLYLCVYLWYVMRNEFSCLPSSNPSWKQVRKPPAVKVFFFLIIRRTSRRRLVRLSNLLRYNYFHIRFSSVYLLTVKMPAPTPSGTPVRL